MIKFIKDGKVKYVQLEGDNRPRKVTKKLLDELRKQGIILDTEEPEDTQSPSGINQNDLQCLNIGDTYAN